MSCYVIAEIGQAHDGSLGTAHAYIDSVASAGVDAVKFQTHLAAAESTPREPWRVRFSPQDETRYDYWRRMEFTEQQWGGLREHADEAGIDFISSPFSVEAVELLQRVGVAAWKVASGELSNDVLLTAIADDGGPVVVSSGMSPLVELDAVVARFQATGTELTVLQCTSAYPCPPEQIGLNVMAELRARYGCRVGLSDHSGTTHAGIAGAALGMEALEVHVTHSREAFGPDVVASVTTDELAHLVGGIRFVERALANPVDKDAMADTMVDMRQLFTKSIVASRDLAAGTVLAADDLRVKKPGDGLPASDLPSLLGRTLTVDLVADERISRAHVGDAS